MEPENYVNLFYTVEFVYNGFLCNVNSPITLHFLSRWHLLYAFQFAYNVYLAMTCFMQSPRARGAVIGKFCSTSYLLLTQGVEVPCVLCSPRQDILR